MSSHLFRMVDFLVEEIFEIVKKNENISIEDTKMKIKEKMLQDLLLQTKSSCSSQPIKKKRTIKPVVVDTLAEPRCSDKNSDKKEDSVIIPNLTLSPPPPPIPNATSNEDEPLPLTLTPLRGGDGVEDITDKVKEESQTSLPTFCQPKLGEEDDLFDLVKKEHFALPIEKICEPLPAAFWKNSKKFQNGYGDLYCTTERISTSSDYIDVILMKDYEGKLRIVGTIFSANLPIVISQVILQSNGNHQLARTLFAANLRKPSTFEYGCELLEAKGIKYGTFNCY